MIQQTTEEKLKGYVQKAYEKPEEALECKRSYIKLRQRHGLDKETAERLFEKAMDSYECSAGEFRTSPDFEGIEGLEEKAEKPEKFTGTTNTI